MFHVRILHCLQHHFILVQVSDALPTELGLGEDRLTEGGKRGKREKREKEGKNGRKNEERRGKKGKKKAKKEKKEGYRTIEP